MPNTWAMSNGPGGYCRYADWGRVPVLRPNTKRRVLSEALQSGFREARCVHALVAAVGRHA